MVIPDFYLKHHRSLKYYVPLPELSALPLLNPTLCPARHMLVRQRCRGATMEYDISRPIPSHPVLSSQ